MEENNLSPLLVLAETAGGRVNGKNIVLFISVEG